VQTKQRLNELPPTKLDMKHRTTDQTSQALRVAKRKFTALKLDLVAAILADAELSSSASRIAAAVILKWFREERSECFASYDAIAEAAGIKRRATVINAIQELDRHNWLKIEKRGRGKGGRSHTNRLWPNFDRVRNGTQSVPLEGINGTLFVQNGTESVPYTLSKPSLPSGGENGFREEGVASPGAACPGGQPAETAPLEEDAAWIEFVRLYPLKWGMKDAEREFRRIMETGEATPARILHGLRQYVTTKPKRWLSPERWLRGGHYADEIQPEPVRQAKPSKPAEPKATTKPKPKAKTKSKGRDKPAKAPRKVEAKPAEKQRKADEERQASEQNPAFSSGRQVRHNKFGIGRVLEQDGSKLTVDFGYSGRKMVLDSFVTPAEDLTKGRRVSHAGFGLGTVMEDQGHTLAVKFDEGPTERIFASFLTPVEA
jgi:hypothetical protein